MARDSKKRTGARLKHERLIVLLLGSALLAFGTIVPGILVSKSVRGYLKTDRKVSVAAEIHGLERVGPSRRRHTRIEYSYRYKGNTYTGTKVALFGESRSLYRHLRKAHDTARPIPVWIDPDDPSYAVIERDWNWQTMILVVVFFGGISAIGGYLLRWLRHGGAPNPKL